MARKCFACYVNSWRAEQETGYRHPPSLNNYGIRQLWHSPFRHLAPHRHVSWFLYMACSFLFALSWELPDGRVGAPPRGSKLLDKQSLCRFRVLCNFPVCDFFFYCLPKQDFLGGDSGSGRGCLHAMFNVWRLLLISHRLWGPSTCQRIRRTDSPTARRPDDRR